MNPRYALPAFFLYLVTLPTPVVAEPTWWKAMDVPQLDFPRDHGAHPEAQTEWWYVTGVVRDEAESLFGYQLTFFRRGMTPAPPSEGESPLRARQVYAAHLAVADVSARSFYHADRVRRQAAGLAGAATTHLNVWLETWTMEQKADELIVLRASDPVKDFEIQLTLRPLKPLVRQGRDGLSQKGPEPGNASIYLTWMRLATEGSIRITDRTIKVQGESWMDHEYGSSQLGEGVVGWDWFGLRLDGNRELMLYQLRRRDGTPTEFSSGTLVDADGKKTTLKASDFEIQPTQFWMSPETGAEYPAAWHIQVPGHDLDFTATAWVANCEIDSSGAVGTVYWEGPVRLEGNVNGEGYAELTGYATSLEDRF